jgi:hypothetical protein
VIEKKTENSRLTSERDGERKGWIKGRKDGGRRTCSLVTVVKHGDVPRLVDFGIVHVVKELVEGIRSFGKFCKEGTRKSGQG